MNPDYLARAARALASAKLLLVDGDLNGACNRAYYAMFEAAHAALAQSDSPVSHAQTKTHRGLISAFGKQVVKPGLLSADLGQSLNQVERIRLLADYTDEEVDSDKAQWAIDQAKLFLEAVEGLYSQQPND